MGLTVFADRFRSEMVPLANRFCYFCAAVSLNSEDLREYLGDPIAALPPAIAKSLPEIDILLVPYLERGAAKNGSTEAVVATERPSDARAVQSDMVIRGDRALFAFAVKEGEAADLHYRFYSGIAGIVAGSGSARIPTAYTDLLIEELQAGAHGEIDEESWKLKQSLGSGAKARSRGSASFLKYAHRSFIDTLTLYLHGICCDIDVEPGPRQLASAHMRKRLRVLKSLFPPPDGYSVLPEDLKTVI